MSDEECVRGQVCHIRHVQSHRNISVKTTFELHHVVFLRGNGKLYDMNNLHVVTPKKHTNLHSQRTGEQYETEKQARRIYRK
jgi:uncharacterized protein YaiI (UPF0178 family)